MKKLITFPLLICMALALPKTYGNRPGCILPEEEPGNAMQPGENMSMPITSPPMDGNSVIYTSKALYINVTPSQSFIYNSDIFSDDTWEITKGFGINFEVGYLFKINNIFGFGFGLGTSSYSTEIKSSPFSFNVQDYDIDNDSYDKRMEFSGLSEKTLINYLDIPVFLEFSNLNIDKLGFYGRVGVKVSLPYSNSLTASGNATYSGYYAQYHVLLENIPELGFTDSPVYNNAGIDLNTVNVSANISAGITYPVSNYLIIKVGANGTMGLMEISAKKAVNYEKTKYDGSYNKLLGNPNATTITQSYGVEIGLIYNLRLY